MSGKTRILLLALGSLGGVMAVAAFLVTRIDITQRFETAATEASGLQVTVESASLRLLPSPRVTATGVRIRNGNSGIATASSASVGIAVWPLLRNQVKVERLLLENLDVAIERNRDGSFNFTRETKSSDLMPAMRLLVAVTGASFRYVNHATEREIAATKCDVESSDLHVAAGRGADLLRNASLSATVACGEIRNEKFTGSDVKATVAGEDGLYTIKPLTMSLLAGAGSGQVEADFTRSEPQYHVQYAVERLALDDLFASVSPTKHGEGVLTFTADLRMKGVDSRAMMATASGEATLQGENLEVAIGNLDEKLSRYEDSQSFNLVDLGAFFIAGPLGTAVTKGYDFANIFADRDGATHIRALVSHWQVKNGARADDVAFATAENRLAMTGSLNFVTRAFEGVTVSVLDEKGCAKIEQRIGGSFDKPDIVKPNVLASLAGPVARVIGEVKELAGAKCEVVYAGTVGR